MATLKFQLDDAALNTKELITILDLTNKDLSLELNLLPKENHIKFANLQKVLQEKYPEKFPLTIKLNENINDEVFLHIN